MIMLDDTFDTHPGLLISLLYISAGIIFVGFTQGVALAMMMKKNKTNYLLYGILCLIVALIQISVAQYHSSTRLIDAIFHEKQLNTLILLFIPLIYAWIKVQTAAQVNKFIFGALITVSVFSIIINFILPYSARFGSLHSSNIITFFYGEKLLILRGEPSFISLPLRFIATIVFVWIIYTGYRCLRSNERVQAFTFLFGGIFLVISAVLGGLVDHGTIDSVYLGGTGFLILMLSISFLVSKDWIDARNQVQQLTFYDPLTGLSNRTLLTKQLENTLASLNGNKYLSVIILFDIVRFKSIVAAHGHAMGDRILIALGHALTDITTPEDTVARMGSDHFAILIPNAGATEYEALSKGYKLARKIQVGIVNPLTISNGEYQHLTIHAGIAVGPKEHVDNATTMLQRAEAALHKAKETPSGEICSFDETISKEVKDRLDIDRELRDAIKNNELLLYLQPQFNSNGTPVDAEALVRWQHPVRGLITPNIFIPIAEESKLLMDISIWVFSEVCKLLSQLNVSRMPVNISVNLSSTFFHEEYFVPWFRDLLASHGTDPTHLTIEITENLMISDLSKVIAIMSEINALGVRFSIDDFGTGYSSLAYLKRLPIHELKIDKSFMLDAPGNPEDAALIKTMIAVAKNLNLRIVAEGVETKRHADYLNNLDRDIIHQGYYYSHPLPVNEWLEKWVTPTRHQQIPSLR